MEATQFILFRMLPPLALAVFLAGALKLILSWRKTPIPFDRGLAGRGRPLSGRSLYSLAHLCMAAGAYICLVVLAARHARYFISPAPLWSPSWAGPSHVAGMLLVILITLFWMRRMLAEPAALLTGWREHSGFGLFLTCALSGVALRWWGGLDPETAQAAARGMFVFQDNPMPRTGFLFCLHFGSALALLALFPLYALPRLVSRFFNPALSSAKAGPHTNPWAREYAGDQASPASTLPGEPEPYSLEKYRGRLKGHWRELGTGRVASAGERMGRPQR